MILTATGTVKEGKLTLSNRKRFESDLTTFKDGLVEVTLKRKARRSNPMNRYYWAVIVKEIEVRMKELGNDVDSELVHEFLKDKFNKKPLVGPEGELIDYIAGSTTEMSKEDMSIYWDKIVLWAAETLGLAIPAPNQTLTLNF